MERMVELSAFMRRAARQPPHVRYITRRQEVIFSNTPYIFRLTVEHE